MSTSREAPGLRGGVNHDRKGECEKRDLCVGNCWSPQDKPTSYGIVTVNGELKSRPAVALLVRFHSPDGTVSAQLLVHPAESGGRSASEAFDKTEERTLQEAL